MQAYPSQLPANGHETSAYRSQSGEYSYSTSYAQAEEWNNPQSNGRSERGGDDNGGGSYGRQYTSDYDYQDMARRSAAEREGDEDGAERFDPRPSGYDANGLSSGTINGNGMGRNDRQYTFAGTATDRPVAEVPFNPKQPLRRNAACRSCRRRKLKCDAKRPHCSACLRSHQHALRTGQKLNPVLDCQYDVLEDEADEQPSRLLSASELTSGRKSVIIASPDSLESGGAARAPVKKRRTSSGPYPQASEEMTDEAILNRLVQKNDPQTLQRYINMLQSTLATNSSSNQHSREQSGSGSGDSGSAYGAPQLPLASKAWAPAPIPAYTYRAPAIADDPHDQSLLNLLSATAAAAAIENQAYSSDTSPNGHTASTGSVAQIQLISDFPTQQDDTQALLQDVFFPGWPRDLPEPGLMDQLLEVFFSVVPILQHVLQRARFLSRMTLPPTHHNFPFVGILHAICAAVPRYYGGNIFVEMVTCNWESLPKPEDPRTVRDFGRRHEALARAAIERSLAQGRNLFECAQALAVLMHHYYTEARWLDGWMAQGMLCRLLVPLGVMKTVDPATLGPPGKGTLLPNPKDDVERNERYNLVWAAAIFDISMESSSGWPGALNFDEINIPLPSATVYFDAGGYIPETSQHAQSCDIFMQHPVADGFCLYVKCILLLRKINRFVRNMSDNSDKMAAVRESAAFRDLDAQIGTFILAFPPSLRDPLKPSPSRFRKSMDHDLFTTQLLLHHQAVKLHEPFVDYRDIDNASTRRVLAGARGILKLIYLLSATSHDIRLVLHGEFALLTATRVLISFLEVELETQSGAAGTKETLEAEIEVFRCLFAARGQKFPIGLRQSRMVEGLLERARKGEATPGYGCVHKKPEPMCAMGVTVVS